VFDIRDISRVQGWIVAYMYAVLFATNGIHSYSVVCIAVPSSTAVASPSDVTTLNIYNLIIQVWYIHISRHVQSFAHSVCSKKLRATDETAR
jgi:hypothetical protein